MLERLFELAFKFRPVVFGQGELAFSPPWPLSVVLLAGLAASAAAAWAYVGTRRRAGRLATSLLLGVRLGAIALLVLGLLRPVMVLKAIAPQQNLLAVVMDDSRSLSLTDDGATPRGAFMAEAFRPGAPLRQALADRFALRFFRFSSAVDRASGPEGLTFSGTRSHIGQALAQVSDELAGLPASGIVLVSDGADTSAAPMADLLRSLRAAGLPVFTIGLGKEALARDVQIGRVEPPTRVLAGTTLVVDVLVGHAGYAAQTVEVIVEDEGRRVGSESVALPRGSEPVTARVRFTLDEPGPRVLTFRIPPLEGEQVTGNNRRDALVVVEDRREKLLYIEGGPRFEMKFLRQAVAADRNLQAVTLQRTADRKFLRLDVEAASDLAGGFPKSREELFTYRGLLLGSIEASAFTPDQLRMIADFVSVRGGGLLALGGRRSFAEGGWAGTPVAEALPVVVGTEASDEAFLASVSVRPTPLGETHVATQIAGTAQASVERWSSLPALSVVNPIRDVKPGAAVLLSGGAETGADQVVLAYQRFGAGKAIAFAVQDSWLWQMHADIAVDDMTHETLWRRLLRWVVDGAPGRVEARVDRERVEPGEPVVVSAVVRDERFVEVNNATVHARVIGPSGRETDLPLDGVLDRDGEFRGRFVTSEAGLYEARVEAQAGTSTLGSDVAHIRAAPDDAEYFDAAMRAPLLKRIADETGGRFHTPASAASLPEEITYLGKGVTVVEEKDLWDMPAALLLLVILAGGEWLLRRRVGLA